MGSQGVEWVTNTLWLWTQMLVNPGRHEEVQWTQTWGPSANPGRQFSMTCCVALFHLLPVYLCFDGWQTTDRRHGCKTVRWFLHPCRAQGRHRFCVLCLRKHSVIQKGRGSRIRCHRVKSKLSESWGKPLTFLCLSVLICKVGTGRKPTL